MFILRHVFRTVYPPLPAAAVLGLLAILAVGLAGLVFLAALGLGGGVPWQDRALLLTLFIAGMVPPAMTVSNTRMSLPLLALLLPLAGLGAARLRASPRRSWVLAAGLALLLLLNATALAHAGGLSPEASLYYRGSLMAADRVLGSRTTYSDCLRMRRQRGGAPGPDLEVSLLDPADRFLRHPERRVLLAAGRGKPLRIDVYSRSTAGRGPLRLGLGRPGEAPQTVIEPLRREAWQVWQPSGLPGVEVRWCGGGGWAPRAE